MVDRQDEPGYASTNPDVSAPAWDPNVPPTGPGVPGAPQPMAVADYSTDPTKPLPNGLAASSGKKQPAPVIQTKPQAPQQSQMAGLAQLAQMAGPAMAAASGSGTPVTPGPTGTPTMGGMEMTPASWSNGTEASGPQASGGLAAIMAQQPATADQPGITPVSTGATTAAATPAAAPGIDPVAAMYDRFSKMSPGRKPATEEEMKAQRGEDMRTAIALALLEFGAGAAKNDYAGGLSRGGQQGLLSWRSMRKDAEDGQDKATQQQFANEVGLAQLASNVEKNKADRESNALYRQALLGQRGQQQDQLQQYRNDQLAAQVGGLQARLDAQKEFQAQQAQRWDADRQSREDIAAGKQDAPAKGKSVSDIYLELRKQNADNFINPKTDDQLLQEAQKISALGGGGGGAPAAAVPGGGSPYRGDSPPVANAQKAPDGNWYVKGQDGRWQQVLQR